VALSDFTSDSSDEMSQEDVADHIEAWTGIEPTPRSNGYTFYARDIDGEPEQGTVFAVVLPGPRLCFDPTVKQSVYGEFPTEFLEKVDFEQTNSWSSSLRYSIKLDSEFPDGAQQAVEWSYGLFTNSG